MTNETCPGGVGGFPPTCTAGAGLSQSSSYQPNTVGLGSYRISQKFINRAFINYLNQTKTLSLRATGTDRKGKKIVCSIPYVHRWSEIYRKSMVAKLYQLEKWLGDNPGVVSMFTLTTYQGSTSQYHDGSYSRAVKGHDLDMQECLDLLKVSRAKLLDVIRHKYPGINYYWVMEPHKTGYPHCHLIIFKEFSDDKQTEIKTLWSEKYQAGSYDRGIDITSKNSDQSIKSIRNYLLKYMGKQFGTGVEKWTKEEISFNALMWTTKTRMWGCSKELTGVMEQPASSPDVEWDLVEMVFPSSVGSCSVPIWNRTEGEPFPETLPGVMVDDPEYREGAFLWRGVYRYTDWVRALRWDTIPVIQNFSKSGRWK